MASEEGKADVVNVLIRHGGDVHAVNKVNKINNDVNDNLSNGQMP